MKLCPRCNSRVSGAPLECPGCGANLKSVPIGAGPSAVPAPAKVPSAARQKVNVHIPSSHSAWRTTKLLHKGRYQPCEGVLMCSFRHVGRNPLSKTSVDWGNFNQIALYRTHDDRYVVSAVTYDRGSQPTEGFAYGFSRIRLLRFLSLCADSSDERIRAAWDRIAALVATSAKFPART